MNLRFTAPTGRKRAILALLLCLLPAALTAPADSLPQIQPGTARAGFRSVETGGEILASRGNRSQLRASTTSSKKAPWIFRPASLITPSLRHSHTCLPTVAASFTALGITNGFGRAPPLKLS